ncbi:MAG TPA: HAMP domain-containing sensor histidine kinase [Gemmatimonadaceae bacterium]|nr:HAMP domain-containing sensor histidine kinase [Gemmatimonadaceae bacterium]
MTMDVFERHVRDTEERVCRDIARELRNPLFGISSAAQLLRFRTHDDPLIERNIGRILHDVERLNALAAELFEFGRPRPLTLAPHDPDAIWDAVLAAQRGLLESRSLEWRRTRVTPPVLCALDHDEITQLFRIALERAVESAPVCTALTLSSARLADGAWQCTLRDEGEAMPEEALPNAFELFSGPRTASKVLPLALCRRIAEAHGGAVRVEIPSDRGTTLVITFPSSA